MNAHETQSESGQNVILTGLPRGGTTLTCHLLNKVPDVVALHEPMELGRFMGLSRPDIMLGIDEFFGSARRSLVEHRTAPSKVENGRVPDNPWSDTRDESGKRFRRVEIGEFHIGRPLSSRFRLVVKHPAIFTALLPDLSKQWPCFAVIRNPLGVLMSWESIADIPVRRGRLPMAEHFSAGLRSSLDAIPDDLDRSLYLLNWIVDRYRSVLPEHRVIHYENMIASGGRALAVIDPAAAALDEPLANKNSNPVYNRELVDRTATRLIEHGGAWEHWYSRHEIETLAATLLDGDAP